MLPKINAVFEEESKNESSSHNSFEEIKSSSDPSVEDPRDHDVNYAN
jgi:hypothetical protein